MKIMPDKNAGGCRRRFFCFLAAALLCASLGARATAEEFDDLYSTPDESDGSKPACSIGHSVTATREINNNIFRFNTDAAADTVMRYNFSGSAECDGASGTIRFEYGYEYDKFKRYFSENFGKTNIDLTFRREYSENVWSEIETKYSVTESQELALVEQEGRNTEFKAVIGRQVSDLLTMEVYYHRNASHYELYDENDSATDGVGAQLTYDIGGFSYVELNYEKKSGRYKGVYLLDESGYDTASKRKDSSSAFSVAITKTFSLVPISYLQLSAGKTQNKSNSNQYYDWFNPVTQNYYFKIVSGSDSYSDLDWSIIYSRGINVRTTVTLFHLRDHAKYPSMYVDTDDFTVEPHTPLDYSIQYTLGSVSYAFSDKARLDVSRTHIKSASNSQVYSYMQNIYNAGISMSF
jgi:hypothetical protein